MPTVELPASVVIPQHHSPFEEALEVPSVYVERFRALTQLACQETAVYPNLVAAVAIEEGEQDENLAAARVLDLAAADAYVREHPGEPYVNANRACFTAGIIDENDGLVVVPWHTSISYGTGLVIPSTAHVEVGFSGWNIRSIEGKVPSKEQVKFITPNVVATPAAERLNHDGSDAIKKAEGGFLAVGEKAVQLFRDAVAKDSIADGPTHMHEAFNLAMPLLKATDR